MTLRTIALMLLASLAACAPTGDEEDVEAASNAFSMAGPVLRDPIAVFIDGEDLPPFRGRTFSGPVPITSSPRHYVVQRTLRLTLQVQGSSAAAVRGCVVAFPTEGLSPREIRAKEAEAARTCASPSDVLQGREGWTLREATPTAGLSQLRFDATPLLAPSQRLLFFFELDGIDSRYAFATGPDFGAP